MAAPIASAEAKPSPKKAIFGAPVTSPFDNKSMFPIYKRMGVGIFQYQLNWNQVAPRRPKKAMNPRDRAYRWPSEISLAIREARKYDMRVALQVQYAPRWANGGRARNWAPKRARDYARFVAAASRKYKYVRLWMIWGEPSRRSQFQPLPRFSEKGARRYARILDAAYGSLKRVRRSNRVIGGNTFTTGDVPPKQFIKGMRLPNGRRPRMDMYGHNPFTKRTPNLKNKPLPYGYADFSDLDTLAKWLDRYFGKRRRLPLYLSEFTAPTDHPNREFDFYVTREVQAKWLTKAFRIARRWRRIYTLGWVHVYDEPHAGPNGPHGDEVHGGLFDWTGKPKPSYYAYKRA